MYAMDEDWNLESLTNFGTISRTAQIHLRKLYVLALMYLVGIVGYSQVVVQQASRGDADYVQHVVKLVLYFARLLIQLVLVLVVAVPLFVQENKAPDYVHEGEKEKEELN
ncbi:unnamed protein product [Ilex paraguariensis]|uniref:Uncharacterized protein n=1 Tax=Ilex paraguariensis TaxID=185542 RepID=A0ABC8RWR4_9AQUA